MRVISDSAKEAVPARTVWLRRRAFGTGTEVARLRSLRGKVGGCMRVISDSAKEQFLPARFCSRDERSALELESQGYVACEEKAEVACV